MDAELGERNTRNYGEAPRGWDGAMVTVSLKSKLLLKVGVTKGHFCCEQGLGQEASSMRSYEPSQQESLASRQEGDTSWAPGGRAPG